jgi:FkbM family methyltransferase
MKSRTSILNLKEQPSDRYCEYLFNFCPDADASIFSYIENLIEATNWQNPQTAQDWNNIAVIYLIEAEQSEDSRAELFGLAIKALENGYAIDQNPLCAAHYALSKVMIGEKNQAYSLTFSTLLSVTQLNSTSDNIQPGLIYMPFSGNHSDELVLMLQNENGYTQSLMLLAEVLWRSQLVFYNSSGMRNLAISNQIFPTSPQLHLMSGIGKIMSRQVEGLLNLHQAYQLCPNNSVILQALYLGYRTIGDSNLAQFWLDKAKEISDQNNDDDSETIDLEWTRLAVEQKFTYLTFEQNLLIAVEPSFQSIVTSILNGQNDWFEEEMEFWRNTIKPGMIVIDVGANAGFYTFSAANRVGEEGLVVAIEPFPPCVSYLQETCRVNQLTNVRVIAAAASEKEGKIKLAISNASELNQVISDEESNKLSSNAGDFTEVEAVTLDRLIETLQLSQVDLLKIDAEGHEINVLQGSEKLLAKFAPKIIYENIAGAQGYNSEVGEFLKARGYSLYRYQPFLGKLLPVSSEAEMQQCLNIIAISSL